MALDTEDFRLLLADCPAMSLVAVEALQSGLGHMQVMLSHSCFVAVAVLQTVLAGQLDLSMRLMTVKAFQ